MCANLSFLVPCSCQPSGGYAFLSWSVKNSHTSTSVPRPELFTGPIAGHLPFKAWRAGILHQPFFCRKPNNILLPSTFDKHAAFTKLQEKMCGERTEGERTEERWRIQIGPLRIPSKDRTFDHWPQWDSQVAHYRYSFQCPGFSSFLKQREWLQSLSVIVPQ